MPKRNDGNEQDLRVRPELDAPSLSGDNPYDGGEDSCGRKGTQVDLEVSTPSGSTTLSYDWADILSVCSKGFDVQSLNVFFMRVLKSHFSNPDNFMNQELSDLVYSDDEQESNLRIAMNTEFDRSSGGKQPAIIVKRGPQKPSRIVVDDLGESGDFQNGEPVHTQEVTGMHSMIVTSTADGLTELLSQEVFDLFNCLSPVFRRILPVYDFSVGGLDSTAVLESNGQLYGVKVVCQYKYDYSWGLRWTGPVLRFFTSNITSELENVG